MNKLIITTIAAMVVMASCKKAEKYVYGSADNVYFDFRTPAERDSVVYTFAYNREKPRDTVWLPVRLSGIRTAVSRNFRAQVIDTATTAVANIHYQPLEPAYTLPVDSGAVLLPVIVLNEDTTLRYRTVALTLQLTSSDELGVGLISLIKARIVISNKLEKPRWWDMWLGSYSEVKHQLFRLSSTTEELTTEGIDAPKNLFYAGKLTAFLNNPKSWIDANPDKGYVLKERPDGNYDFYHSSSPDKTILYRKNTSSGKFYFIDETGKEVS